MNKKISFAVITIVLVIGVIAGVLLVLSNNTHDNQPQDTTPSETEYVSTASIYCQYTNTLDIENSVEALRFYIPSNGGYINYNLVHSVDEKNNTDVWRLSQAYLFDENFQSSQIITLVGGEWDMAVMIAGRDDFIGGFAHGDELFTDITFEIDGKTVDVNSLTELTKFKKIVIRQNSVGYDPDDHTTQVLKHYKEYTVDHQGVLLNQTVKWLGNFSMGKSYLTMLPPLKALTDHFYTNADPEPKAIAFGSYEGVREALVFGVSSGLHFKISILKHPQLQGGNVFMIHDNGNPYNKMYYTVCDGHDVAAGDVWETSTRFTITIE